MPPPPGRPWPPARRRRASASGADEPPPAPSAKEQADDEIFFLRMLKPFTRYQPPVDALRSAGPRIVVAVGATSREEIARRSAEALAEQLGSSGRRVPRRPRWLHGRPAGFAAAIREVTAG